MSRPCDCCLGTGKQLIMRTWFVGDGYKRERCGTCSGTGKSTYQDKKWAAYQRRCHARDAAMRAAPKGLDYIALGRIANAAVQS